VLALGSSICETLEYDKPWSEVSIGMVVVAVLTLVMVGGGYLAKLWWLRLRIWWVLR
jgi:hypothetical protein